MRCTNIIGTANNNNYGGVRVFCVLPCYLFSQTMNANYAVTAAILKIFCFEFHCHRPHNFWEQKVIAAEIDVERQPNPWQTIAVKIFHKLFSSSFYQPLNFIVMLCAPLIIIVLWWKIKHSYESTIATVNAKKYHCKSKILQTTLPGTLKTTNHFN